MIAVRRALSRLPAVTLLLAALAVMVFVTPGAAPVLEYDRSALAAGQVWRLVTGHWTHWSAAHLAWDLAAFLVLGAVCERRRRGRFLVCVAVAALAVSLTSLWARPDLMQYRGLSGVDSALFVLAAVLSMQHASDSRELVAGAWALVAFLLKVSWEGATGGGVFVHGSDAGFTAVPLAHVAGAAVGFVVGAARNAPGRRRFA